MINGLSSSYAMVFRPRAYCCIHPHSPAVRDNVTKPRNANQLDACRQMSWTAAPSRLARANVLIQPRPAAIDAVRFALPTQRTLVLGRISGVHQGPKPLRGDYSGSPGCLLLAY